MFKPEIMMVMLPLFAAVPILPDTFDNAPVVPVELSNFQFKPAAVHLAAGRPVILRLVNNSSGGHDFGAPDFFAGASVPAEDKTNIRNGHVELDAHKSIDIRLVPQSGTYRLSCDHPFHALFGMKGTIVVQ